MFSKNRHYLLSAAVACLGLPAMTAQAADLDAGLKGPNVQYVLCRGVDNGQQYMVSGPKEWTVKFRNGAHHLYKEVNRDEWSVYLEGDDGSVQLDLFRKECTWVKNNTKRVNEVVAAHTP